MTGTTSLTRFAGSRRDPDPQGARKAARALWHELGIIVIFPDQISGLERDLAQAVAAKHYGKRGKR